MLRPHPKRKISKPKVDNRHSRVTTFTLRTMKGVTAKRRIRAKELAKIQRKGIFI